MASDLAVEIIREAKKMQDKEIREKVWQEILEKKQQMKNNMVAFEIEYTSDIDDETNYSSFLFAKFTKIQEQLHWVCDISSSSLINLAKYPSSIGMIEKMGNTDDVDWFNRTKLVLTIRYPSYIAERRNPVFSIVGQSFYYDRNTSIKDIISDGINFVNRLELI